MAHTEQYVVSLGERGRLVLPASPRRHLGLHPGERLLLIVEPTGCFRVVRARKQAQRLVGIYCDLAPGRSFVDDVAKTSLAAILQQYGLDNVRSL
jgi:bifunctional DNA-binding transcriptional regulator/antitoxin component of YhaV-PrlF toxin-antitoxin module